MAPATRTRPSGVKDSGFSRASEHRNSQIYLLDELSAAERNNMSNSEPDDPLGEVPPVYTIDLSLPPAQRYVKVVEDFKPTLKGLTTLFDELLEDVNLPKKPFHLLTRSLLHRLHSREQTEELRGISKVIGVPMYLLVAYNVLLDIFMGCTSGGVMVKERGQQDKKMMHFRTLDWGMPALRKAIVQFEFKESKTGPVVARSISYVGFVGVLTGVRQGLSMSLNFRPYHNDDTSRRSNLKFYAHLAMVIIGFRPSIAAHLRDMLLPGRKERERNRSDSARPQKLADIAKEFPSVPTTAAYLILCDGKQTLVLEKDRVTAKPLLSSSFITTTNHDASYERSDDAQAAHIAHAKTKQFGIGMEDLVEESIDRKGCIVARWERRCKRFGAQARANGNEGVYVGLEELKRWVEEYPVTNEETHFVTIMNPSEGKIAWIKRFEEPNEYETETETEAGE